MYRITMCYDNDPTRTIIAVVGRQPPVWGWSGRECQLTVSGRVDIESISGPRYDAGEDANVWESDWDMLVDSHEGEFELRATAEGWVLDLGTNDFGTPVTVLEPVETIEEEK